MTPEERSQYLQERRALNEEQDRDLQIEIEQLDTEQLRRHLFNSRKLNTSMQRELAGCDVQNREQHNQIMDLETAIKTLSRMLARQEG